ncbi:MAG TPA: protein kinase [Terriglobales bacterium]|nr:protein kinase [Terriglobales bacterium]
MALSNGTRLGPYQIVAPLGAGGMGEVYRARDTRLERTVAIKILPIEVCSDPVRKQRFQREAKIISSLNHPHICVLHDIGSQEGIDFLVLECIEGETLANRLEKGPLPAEEVLKYGTQIADALDKAHRSGVVHRDLKPGNIMVTPAGAKLLDFGLAKPTAPFTSDATLVVASKPSPVTERGVIVGTFQYMSPEQVEGKEADARTDIFSLGAVLYEMVTGQRAFDGKSQLSVASAILEKEPTAVSSVKPLTPPALDHAIRRCLAKDREERWQTARDLKLELKWISESKLQGAWPAGVSAQEVRPGRRRTLLWAALSVLLAAVAGVAGWMLKPSPPQPVSRAVITLPPGQRLAGLEEPAVALSNDGKELAYVARQGDSQQIYLRSMDNPQARPIPGTEGGIDPFFSPDGQWLGFIADQKLKKVALSGEAVVTLADVVSPHGASWSSQGTIAFADTQVSPVLKVPDAGGTPQPVTRFAPGEVSHRGPEFLPGGKALLFVAARSSFNWSNAQIAVQSLSTGERRDLIKGAFPRYAPSGHLLYAQGGNLLAVPFDTRRLAITGTATPVVEGVLQSTTTGAAQYSISSTGSLVYIAGGLLADQRRLVWVNRAGKEQPLEAPVRAYLFPRLSPDGKHLAVGIAEEGTDIWSYDLTRATLTRLTFGGTQNLNAVWSPDNAKIAFQSQKEGASQIYWQPSDGTGQPERLTTGQYANVPMSWSPDGRALAFIEVNPETGYDLWMLTVKDRKARPFLRTPFNESAPRFSPDGRWLAYISNESGRYEIYVQPFPGPGAKLQISTDGGTEPVWNPRGRELFYRNGDKMMVVDVTATKTTLTAGKPRLLFEGEYLPTPATTPNYDVSSDGQQFLMVKAGGTGEVAPTQINVVLNWFEELKRRVPSGNK